MTESERGSNFSSEHAQMFAWAPLWVALAHTLELPSSALIASAIAAAAMSLYAPWSTAWQLVPNAMGVILSAWLLRQCTTTAHVAFLSLGLFLAFASIVRGLDRWRYLPRAWDAGLRLGVSLHVALWVLGPAPFAPAMAPDSTMLQSVNALFYGAIVGVWMLIENARTLTLPHDSRQTMPSTSRLYRHCAVVALVFSRVSAVPLLLERLRYRDASAGTKRTHAPPALIMALLVVALYAVAPLLPQALWAALTLMAVLLLAVPALRTLVETQTAERALGFFALVMTGIAGMPGLTAAVVLASLRMLRPGGLRSGAEARDDRAPADLPEDTLWCVVESPLSILAIDRRLHSEAEDPASTRTLVLDLRAFAALDATMIEPLVTLLTTRRPADWRTILLGDDSVTERIARAMPGAWPYIRLESSAAAVAQLRSWHRFAYR